MKRFLVLVFFFSTISVMANVRLPHLFGDNMVLQRGKPIPIWGWAAPGEKITIHFHDQTQKATAGKNGKWMMQLKPEAAGGPFELNISGKNQLTIKNILVGEVWICSGQSNMEMNVSSSKNSEEEIKGGDYPMIRHIKIPDSISSVPKDDISSGEWKIASPSTVGSFSAVGYFFARKLYNELKVPIGLINSSWGGTIVETWTSKEAFEGTEEFKDLFHTVTYSDIEAQNEKEYQDIIHEIESREGNFSVNNSITKEQFLTGGDSWKKMELPVNFNLAGLAKFDGTIWFTKTIHLEQDPTGQTAKLNLGKIDDNDETYVNGQLVGKSDEYSIVRQYQVPSVLLKKGENKITVRMTDNMGNGGFYSEPADMNLTCGKELVPLAGEWSYKIESVKKNGINPNSYPTLLFNSMINPLVPFAIKGAIWYQGESNADHAQQYQKAFPLMIQDWRKRFRQGDFPFYFVQLASFKASGGNSNSGSEWAELREAQAKTLSLPNTGMATIIDIGETNDIHPKNKQDVGLRLAAIALNKSYDKKNAFAGPLYKSMKTDGNKIEVVFENADNGFWINDKYKYIKGFEVAGADHKFYYAQAIVENNKIIVSADSVAAPVAVRYAWADDAPDANLYNKEGFPAVPFRSDDWKGITDNKKFTMSK